MGVGPGRGGRATGSRGGRGPRKAPAARDAPARGPRAVVYLLGAAAVAAGVAAGELDLPRTALAVAAVLVLVGLAGGPSDGPWGAALVVAGAGAGALLAPELPARLDLARETAAGIGAGLGLVCVLPLELAARRWGVAATLLAVVATAGVLLDDVDLPALHRPSTWAALLFLLGTVNLLLWARDRELAAAAPKR
ncbi:hypothetical protein AB0L40_18045 [Patulibacter sp. NPDC049589]|uniref:hypothetical protein n=1 Tax=Patulibacter sp. NPDC049589 TaxID=3154731 RepID=UPI0034357C59